MPLSQELAESEFSLPMREPRITVTYFPSIEAAAERAIGETNAPHHGAFIALNAEKMVKLYKDPKLFSTVQNVLYYPDGSSVLWFAGQAVPRIPGVELWLKILEKVNNKGGEVLVIGATPEVSQNTYDKLFSSFSEIDLVCIDGFQPEETYFQQIEQTKPDAVFVAMGSPRQELMIAQLQTRHPHCFFMGIGGSLDVLTGKIKRAPWIFRKLGVEFLYRLLLEPSRIFRQTALFKFVYYYFAGVFGVEKTQSK
ncbi:MAG TPA: glycosyltransferase [Rhodobiaceae bacterium]|nr:glycosyltransferase [Rhodobiaceae bacterium]|tara:strand:- start:6629 stop:7387 length:759 start_codon:yes stop_codon:yes gene_type:complete